MLITLNISIKSPFSCLSFKVVKLNFFPFFEKDKVSQFCQYPFVSRDSTLAHHTPNVALLDIHLALYTIFLISNVLFSMHSILFTVPTIRSACSLLDLMKSSISRELLSQLFAEQSDVESRIIIYSQ